MQQDDTQPQLSVELSTELARIVQDIHNNTFVEMVPVHVIKVAGYCRAVTEFRVNQMIREGFTLQKMDMLKLAMQQDGSYHILDGRHRLEAARKLGLPILPARVFIDLTYEQEAELFRAFNTTKRTSAMDTFRADVEARKPDALTICLIAEEIGMEIGLKGPGYPKSLSSIAVIQRTYADLGASGLREVFSILHRAWGQERRAWISAMMDGFRQFWGRYRTEVNVNQLVDRLSLMTPEHVLRQANVVTSSTRGTNSGTLVGKQLVDIYNSRRKNKLSDWSARNEVGYSGTKRWIAGRLVSLEDAAQMRGEYPRARQIYDDPSTGQEYDLPPII